MSLTYLPFFVWLSKEVLICMVQTVLGADIGEKWVVWNEANLNIQGKWPSLQRYSWKEFTELCSYGQKGWWQNIRNVLTFISISYTLVVLDPSKAQLKLVEFLFDLLISINLVFWITLRFVPKILYNVITHLFIIFNIRRIFICCLFNEAIDNCFLLCP